MRHVVVWGLAASLCLGIVVFAGCGRGKTPTAVEQPAAVAEYDIKVGNRKVGQKMLVDSTAVREVVATGPNGTSETHTDQIHKEEYVEHIVTADGDTITKVSRAYRVAKRSKGSGDFHNLPYAGKTVLIEKVGDLFVYSIDGVKLSQDQADGIDPPATSLRPGVLKYFPGKPVPVPSSWPLDPGVFRSAGKDPNKCSGTGRLVKVATEGGRPWVTLEFTSVEVTDKVKGARSVTHEEILNFPVDGSPIEGTFTSTEKIAFDPDGPQKVAATAIRRSDMSIRPVK